MILLDANLLIYAKFSDSPQHEHAVRWLEETLISPESIGIPWQTSLAFVRLATNPRMWRRPLEVRAAWQQVTDWLDEPNVWIPEPTHEHAAVLGRLVIAANARGNLVTDANLAAIAIEHNLTVYSSDSDFKRFPDVSWVNPLVVS